MDGGREEYEVIRDVFSWFELLVTLEISVLGRNFDFVHI